MRICNLKGELLACFGDLEEGGRGSSSPPHGVAVDSRGDLYVSDASYTLWGQYMDPPRVLKSLRKFARKRQAAT